MAILDRIHALYAPDPALKFRFYVHVPDVDDMYSCVVDTISATFPKVPAKARFGGGSNTYFPDTNDIDGLSITFYEAYDYRVTAWLSRWRAKVVKPDGTYGLPPEYKRDITVMMFNYSVETPVMTMTYKDCWPTDQNPFALSYEDSEGRLQVEAQFAVDNLELS